MNLVTSKSANSVILFWKHIFSFVFAKQTMTQQVSFHNEKKPITRLGKDYSCLVNLKTRSNYLEAISFPCCSSVLFSAKLSGFNLVMSLRD